MIEKTVNGNRVSGFYRGKIIKHEEAGKCKIMIYGVYPMSWEKTPEKIPNAEQACGLGFDNINGNGFFTYPAIGSIVWCFFANEDQNLPVYFATSIGGSESLTTYSSLNTSGDSETDLCQTNVIQFGNLNITFNKGDKNSSSPASNPSLTISTKHESNSSCIKIDNDGTISIISCGNLKMTATKDIEITSSEGSISINSTKENITINAPANTVNLFSKNSKIIADSSVGNVSITGRTTTLLA